MIIVNTHEAKTNLSKLLNLVVEKHEIVRICRNGKPMADLIEPKKARKKNRLKKNPKLSGVFFYEDPTEPLGDDFLPEVMIAEKRGKYNATS